MEELFIWMNNFELSRPVRKLSRDFSDGVLLAEILKQIAPRLVDMHNYSGCNAYTLKVANWTTLHRKVLKHVGIPLTDKSIEELAAGQSGAIESLLVEIMQKSKEIVDGNNYSGSGSGSGMELSIPLNFDANIDYAGDASNEHCPSLKQELAKVTQELIIQTTKLNGMHELLKLKNDRIEMLTRQLVERNDRQMMLNENLSGSATYRIMSDEDMDK